jgi:hypothetical protein
VSLCAVAGGTGTALLTMMNAKKSHQMSKSLSHGGMAAPIDSRRHLNRQILIVGIAHLMSAGAGAAALLSSTPVSE